MHTRSKEQRKKRRQKAEIGDSGYDGGKASFCCQCFGFRRHSNRTTMILFKNPGHGMTVIAFVLAFTATGCSGAYPRPLVPEATTPKSRMFDPRFLDSIVKVNPGYLTRAVRIDAEMTPGLM